MECPDQGQCNPIRPRDGAAGGPPAFTGRDRASVAIYGGESTFISPEADRLGSVEGTRLKQLLVCHPRRRTAGEALAEIHASTPPTTTRPPSPRYGGSLTSTRPGGSSEGSAAPKIREPGSNLFDPTKLSHPEQESSSGLTLQIFDGIAKMIFPVLEPAQPGVATIA